MSQENNQKNQENDEHLDEQALEKEAEREANEKRLSADPMAIEEEMRKRMFKQTY